MEPAVPLFGSHWPIIVYFVAVMGLVVLMLGLSSLLGQKRKARATGQPFESGIVSVGSARFKTPIPFYLLAIFFVIFDLEAVYLFAWAIAVKEAGWAGFIEAAIFIGVLFAALIYLWKLGALDWRTTRQREQRRNLVK